MRTSAQLRERIDTLTELNEHHAERRAGLQATVAELTTQLTERNQQLLECQKFAETQSETILELRRRLSEPSPESDVSRMRRIIRDFDTPNEKWSAGAVADGALLTLVLRDIGDFGERQHAYFSVSDFPVGEEGDTALREYVLEVFANLEPAPAPAECNCPVDHAIEGTHIVDGATENDGAGELGDDDTDDYEGLTEPANGYEALTGAQESAPAGWAEFEIRRIALDAAIKLYPVGGGEDAIVRAAGLFASFLRGDDETK